MNNHRINLRYATALFEFAAEMNQVEQTFNDVKLIADICNENRDLRLMLKSPVIFSDKKLKVLDEILKGRIGSVIKGFIEILVRKRREEYLPGILNTFIEIYRKSKNIKLAQVTTARILDKENKEQLINILTQQTGSEIILEEHVDVVILGGLIVKIEGVKFDDSVRKKINTLRQEFSVNTYIKGF
jgi:F-type H+-transporting ATPase subunit delta